jgi:hypothetical protein
MREIRLKYPIYGVNCLNRVRHGLGMVLEAEIEFRKNKIPDQQWSGILFFWGEDYTSFSVTMIAVLRILTTVSSLVFNLFSWINFGALCKNKLRNS